MWKSRQEDEAEEVGVDGCGDPGGDMLRDGLRRDLIENNDLARRESELLLAG